MRDRLIEIFKKTNYNPVEGGLKANLANQFSEYALNQIIDNLLAEGVIVPPFPAKIGDKVYRIMCRGYKDFRIREETIWIVDNHANAGLEIITKYVESKGLIYFPKIDIDDIGKTIFLTREEAEKALERSENGKS